ncbi:MAG: PqqD family protein [Kiritimatiellia bacterium]
MTDKFKKADHVISRSVAGEELLIPVCGKLADLQRIFAVNPVAKFVWDLLDEKRDAESLAAAVTVEFDVGADEAAGDVRDFLDSLMQAGLISKVPND